MLLRLHRDVIFRLVHPLAGGYRIPAFLIGVRQGEVLLQHPLALDLALHLPGLAWQHAILAPVAPVAPAAVFIPGVLQLPAVLQSGAAGGGLHGPGAIHRPRLHLQVLCGGDLGHLPGAPGAVISLCLALQVPAGQIRVLGKAGLPQPETALPQGLGLFIQLPSRGQRLRPGSPACLGKGRRRGKQQHPAPAGQRRTDPAFRSRDLLPALRPVRRERPHRQGLPFQLAGHGNAQLPAFLFSDAVIAHAAAPFSEKGGGVLVQGRQSAACRPSGMAPRAKPKAQPGQHRQCQHRRDQKALLPARSGLSGRLRSLSRSGFRRGRLIFLLGLAVFRLPALRLFAFPGGLLLLFFLRRAQALQLPQHLPGALVALLRVIGAGLQHDPLQLRAAVAGRRQQLAPQAPPAGLLLQLRRQLFRRQGQKGHAPLIEQPVQHQAQGIQVHAAAVGLLVIDLRRHVFEGAGPGAAGGFLHGPGHAEVPKLVVPQWGDEDVLGLDVPVDDVKLGAEAQRPAQVPPDGDDLLLLRLLGQCLRQGPEQLHFDVDVPADAVGMLHRTQVLAVDHVGAAAELAHQGILPHDVLQIAPEGLGNAPLLVALAAHLLDLAVVLGKGNKLQGGPFRLAEHFAPDLIHCAEAAPPQESNRLPAGPKLPLCSAVHRLPPSLSFSPPLGRLYSSLFYPTIPYTVSAYRSRALWMPLSPLAL